MIRSFGDLQSILIEPEGEAIPMSPPPTPPVPKTIHDLASIMIEGAEEESRGKEEDGSYCDDEFEDDESEGGTRSEAEESLDELPDEDEGDARASQQSSDNSDEKADVGDGEEDLDDYFARKSAFMEKKSSLAVSSTTTSHTTATVNYNREYEVSLNPSPPRSGGKPTTTSFSHYVPTLSPGTSTRPIAVAARGQGSSSKPPEVAAVLSTRELTLARKNAEIHSMAQGARRGQGQPHRVSAGEVPGLEAYLAGKRAAKQGESSDHMAQGMAAEPSRRDPNMSVVEEVLQKAGFESDVFVGALAAAMEQAQGKLHDDDKLRAVLHRRSVPIKGADGLYARSSRRSGSSSGDPFGRLDVDSDPAMAYGIENWDPDYHAALMSEENKLSARLQGRAREDTLTAYADLQRRLAKLEEKQDAAAAAAAAAEKAAGDTDGHGGEYYFDPDRHVYGKGGIVVNGADVDDSTVDPQVRAQEMSLMTALSLDKEEVPAHLLRTGTDKVHLMLKAQELYATFLGDLVDLCKERASGSSSIEDVAMHRVLAEQVRKTFSGVRNIDAMQASMVAAAIETSLKFEMK